MRYVRALFLQASAVVFSIFFLSGLYCGPLIQGDDKTEGATNSFTLPVKAHTMNRYTSRFYVAANIDGLKDYSLSLVNREQSVFEPLLPETVTLDGAGVSNPLYDKKIKFLSLLEYSIETSGVMPGSAEHPVVVLEDAKTVYVLEQFGSDGQNVKIVSGTGIKDAAAAVTDGIVNIGAYASSIFAAVKGFNGAGFGTNGSFSGIALLAYGDQKIIVGDDAKIQKIILQIGTTVELEVKSDVVKIDANLANLSVSDIYFSGSLKRLYIALNITATNGGRALIVGYIKDNQLVLKPIAPNNAFGGATDIVGCAGAASVSIHKVRTMLSSNRLHYAIVQGGNGAAGATLDTVFAVPLVDNPDSIDTHGTLADYKSNPENEYVDDGRRKLHFASRNFKTPALLNADILKTDSSAAMVGGGPVPDGGEIVDMIVDGDAVFVAVNIVSTDSRKRVYSSRAMFDTEGRISSWTKWAAIYSSKNRIFGIGLDGAQGNLVTMEGTSIETTKIVKSTRWGAGDADGLGDLVGVIGAEFPQETGGVFGLFDFPSGYPGVSDGGVTGASFWIATGQKKIVLAQTGHGNPLVVDKENFSANTVRFENGTVGAILGTTQVVVISGGVLDDVGPVECAEVAYVNNATRIFVGGPGGLAVLDKPDDTGMANPGLDKGFSKVSGLLFKTFGSYQFVRKLIADENFLYVLTDTKLDRISLADLTIPAVTVATTDSLGIAYSGTMLDMVVSGKLCVLATSAGVFRVANGSSVKEPPISWVQLVLPDNDSPAQQLQAITKNGLPQDLKNGGNLYVLGAYVGKNRAKLNRFTVKDYSAIDISDTTIQPLPDLFVKTMNDVPVLSYYANFGSFRKTVSDQGALRFATRDKDLQDNPVFELLLRGHLVGGRLAGNFSLTVPVDTSGSSDIGRVMRSSASGDLIVARDTGLTINE